MTQARDSVVVDSVVYGLGTVVESVLSPGPTRAKLLSWIHESTGLSKTTISALFDGVRGLGSHYLDLRR